MTSFLEAVTRRKPAASLPPPRPRREPRPPKPHRLVDRLAAHASIGRIPEAYVGLPLGGRAVVEPDETLAGDPRGWAASPRDVAEAVRPGALLRTGGAEPIRGRELLAWIESRAPLLPRFVVAPDGSLGYTTAGGRMPDLLRNIIRDAAPLLLGYVSGSPLVCAYRHPGKGPAPEAASLTEPAGLPACADHLAGTLDP
jgi:hypothetical protein